MIRRRRKSHKPAALIVSTILLLAAPIIYTACAVMSKLTFALIVTAIGLAAWGLATREDCK